MLPGMMDLAHRSMFEHEAHVKVPARQDRPVSVAMISSQARTPAGWGASSRSITALTILVGTPLLTSIRLSTLKPPSMLIAL
jgi:hypothetical protein